MSSTPKMHRPLMRLLPVMILNIVELGIALPVLPALALALGGSALDIGLLYMLQSLGQFITAPLWGRLSDRYGRKNILLATFVLAAVAEIATAFAPSLALLYIARLIVGLCAGNVAAASAYISDVTEAHERSKGMAVIGVSFGLGFTIGPAIGALVSYLTPATLGIIGLGTPFLVAGVLSLLTFVLAAIILHEPPITVEERESRREASKLPLRDVLAHPGMPAMCGLFLVYTLSSSILESTFFLYATDLFGLKTEHIGVSFAALGLLLAVVQGSVSKASQKFGDRRMVLMGTVVSSVGLMVCVQLSTLPFFMAFIALATIGRAYIHPGLLAMTSRLPEGVALSGVFLGVLQSSGSLGRIAGPALGGWAYEYISPSSPFVLAGSSLLLVGVIWFRAISDDVQK
jgi:MFS family permease